MHVRAVKFRESCVKLNELGGAVAQLGARLDGIEEVVGSNPIGSTKSPTSLVDSRCNPPPLQVLLSEHTFPGAVARQ